MPYIGLAVTVVGIVALANLALTLLVIKWARRHGDMHARGRTGPPARQMLPAGTQIAAFEAATVTGDACALTELTGARSAAAFLSVRCLPCRDQLPAFISYARAFPGGHRQGLAVVVADGDGDGADSWVSQLGAVATVVVEPLGGAVQTAFSVTGAPSFYLLDDRGRVESSSHSVDALMQAQPA